MPRKKRLRKMDKPPSFKGYKPYGCKRTFEYVNLNYEEYESIKLADYDLLNHDEAAKQMDISRATFARIYESARRKIADALVNVKEIKTVFGNAEFDVDWYNCHDCHARFTIPETMKSDSCPVCNSGSIVQINKENFS